jgi:hypothetical protein
MGEIAREARSSRCRGQHCEYRHDEAEALIQTVWLNNLVCRTDKVDAGQHVAMLCDNTVVWLCVCNKATIVSSIVFAHHICSPVSAMMVDLAPIDDYSPLAHCTMRYKLHVA